MSKAHVCSMLHNLKLFFPAVCNPRILTQTPQFPWCNLHYVVHFDLCNTWWKKYWWCPQETTSDFLWFKNHPLDQSLTGKITRYASVRHTDSTRQFHWLKIIVTSLLSLPWRRKNWLLQKPEVNILVHKRTDCLRVSSKDFREVCCEFNAEVRILHQVFLSFYLSRI